MVEFVPFSEGLADNFYLINQQWISQMFELEPIDEQVLKDPKKHIIDKGGFIWFARHTELGVIGTCALLNKGGGQFELTKMGVLDSARGLKVGETLLKHVIEQAYLRGTDLLFLLTNKKCESAIHLYEKNGFRHDAEIMETYGKIYQRCDVAMRHHRS